jgi:hypothetical protein
LADPADERRHEPGPEELWNESWYFDFTDAEGRLGGYVRLGFYPNQGTAWYWACLVGEGRPLVTVIDHDVPVPAGRSLEIRTDGLWADHTVEVPLDHMTLGCEAFAVGLSDPAEAYGAMRGDRVPFGLDLEWETDGGTYPYPGVTRYEVPCRVHGEILVGDERIDLDGWGQRDHSWGVRDWWTLGWCWTSGRLDDGTRFHATHVTLGDDPVYATGYVQRPGGPLTAVPGEAVDRRQVLGDHGFPTAGEADLGDLSLSIEPVAFSPVLLTAPDGRVSRFPRALCRFTDTGSGRPGVGWTEWNQPPPGPEGVATRVT